MSHSFITLLAIVKGNVQGVGFRRTVQHLANKLGLNGTVCNLSDSSVEIYASGSKETLEMLLESFKSLSYPVKVNSISVTYNEPAVPYYGFEIIKSKP